MKNRMLFLFGLIFSLCFGSPSYAAVGDSFNDAAGIKYEVISEAPAEVLVTSRNFTYDGDIFIPQMVSNGTKSYMVTEIRYFAFYEQNSMTSITIPSTVKSIGLGAFTKCKKLTAILVEDGNENYSSIDGVLYDKDVNELLQFPCGKKWIRSPFPTRLQKLVNTLSGGLTAFRHLKYRAILQLLKHMHLQIVRHCPVF